MAQMQHRNIKSNKNNSFIPHGFQPFERHRKHPKPPHQKAGLQVMYTSTNILFDESKKEITN